MWPMSIINNSIKLLISTLVLFSELDSLITFTWSIFERLLCFIKFPNLDNRIRNVDQLITQDIKVFWVPFPICILILGSHLLILDCLPWNWATDWRGGSNCNAFILLASGAILRNISPPFGDLRPREQSLEGEFRHAHSDSLAIPKKIAFTVERAGKGNCKFKFSKDCRSCQSGFFPEIWEWNYWFSFS